MLNFGEAQYDEVPLNGQRVEKLLRTLFCPRFGGRIRRFRRVSALFSGSLEIRMGRRPPFSTGCGFLRSWHSPGPMPHASLAPNALLCAHKPPVMHRYTPLPQRRVLADRGRAKRGRSDPTLTVH